MSPSGSADTCGARFHEPMTLMLSGQRLNPIPAISDRSGGTNVHGLHGQWCPQNVRVWAMQLSPDVTPCARF